MKNFLISIGILLVIMLAIYMQIELWNECRQTNSFWYCMRVLSK